MRRHLSTLLISAGLLLMAWPALTWGYGVYWQAKLHREWDARRAAPAAAAEQPEREGEAGASTAPVTPAIARLTIERIGLDAMVVEGMDGVSLRRGPGHLPGTVRPGEDGNCVIAAHRDGWFRRLEEVQPRDIVFLDPGGDCAYEYVVVEKRVVDPDRADLLATGTFPTLTLITCTGPGYPHSAYRLLVFCKLQSTRVF
jgi:sortase A